MSSVRGSVDDYLDYIARRPPNEGRPAAIAFRVREAMALGRPIRLRCGAGMEPSGVVVRMTSSGSPTYALTVEFESGETVALDRVTDVGPALQMQPFTPCSLRRVSGPEIPAGAFLLGKRIAYRVDEVRGRMLLCTRWPLDEVPGDALVFEWRWAPRGRASSRVVTGHA